MVRYVFYIYSIRSSITGHLTDRLAIATLSRATSSTAFLSYNPLKSTNNFFSLRGYFVTASFSS